MFAIIIVLHPLFVEKKYSQGKLSQLGSISDDSIHVRAEQRFIYFFVSKQLLKIEL
jgi:hypothetical protein